MKVLGKVLKNVKIVNKHKKQLKND